MNTRPEARRALRLGTLAIALLLVPISPRASSGDGAIHRSTSPDGTAVFSDRAAPGSHVLDPPPLSVVPARAGASDVARVDRASGGARRGDGSFAPVERVAILSPAPDTTVRDPRGPLRVEIDTDPAVLTASGLRAEVLLNGIVVTTARAARLDVPSPVRGTHTLQVRLIDHEGRVIAHTASRALHVHRRTVTEAVGVDLLTRPPRLEEMQ